MILRLSFAFLFLLILPVYAQQIADPDIFRRATGILQHQRNSALDDSVNLRIQLDKVTEELYLAKAKIQELESKMPKEDQKK